MSVTRDRLMQFFDGAVTLAAGTTYSDIVPLSRLGLNVNESKLEVQVVEAFTSGGSATVQFILQKDTLSTFPSAVTVVDSGALAVATLVDNYDILDRFMSTLAYAEAAGSDTFLRIAIITAVADLTAGSFKAGLTLGRPVNTTP